MWISPSTVQLWFDRFMWTSSLLYTLNVQLNVILMLQMNGENTVACANAQFAGCPSYLDYI